MPSIDAIFQQCGYPQVGPDAVAGWNEIDFGSAFTGEIKLGIFGYDITCLAAFCAGIDNQDDDYYCNLIDARGLDGLAFGAYFKTDSANDNYDYNIGFRNTTEQNKTLGNTLFGLDYDGDTHIVTYLFHNFYQVSEEFPNTTTTDNEYSKFYETGYGLGLVAWGSSHEWTTDTDYTAGQAFRFIG